jgi:putative NIF3 family GTP cyclohydrolase 1 type 2
VTGIGQFLPNDGASPAIGVIGTVERVSEERVEVIAPSRSRTQVLAALRTAHPYEEPAFDVFALAPMPTGTGLGRIGTLATPEPLSAFVSRVRDALPATSWGVRAAGDPDGLVSRVAVCGGAGDSLLGEIASAGVQVYVTADLRHHPADEHRRVSGVALVDVAHWASEFPWCGQAAALLRQHFGDALPVRVSAVRTDPWNVEHEDHV